MHNLYIISPSITLTDSLGRRVKDIAVYDQTLLSEYLLGVTLKGAPKDCEKAKKALYRFLEFWDEGERKICVSLSDFSITIYPTEYIESSECMIDLGKRPADPVKEIQSAASKLASAISYKSPNAAKLYEELQGLIKKYPSIKERA